MVEEVGKFLRSGWFRQATFEGWPELPRQKAQKPTKEEANRFFLGCCVDTMTRADVAWRHARRFFNTRLPAKYRSRVWWWIASRPEKWWTANRTKLGLHRFPQRHAQIQKIARAIQDTCQGDVRRLWAPDRVSSLPEQLEKTIEVGPAIARMIVGALRDHGLVSLRKADFKPDRHVTRLMHALGLSPTSKPRDALARARELFQDPWIADTCFYHLGAGHDIKTRTEFLAFYHAMCSWKNIRTPLQRRLHKVMKGLVNDIDTERWQILPQAHPHYVGVYLVRQDGGLTDAFEDGDSLWLWLGTSFEGRALYAGVDIGGDTELFDAATRACLKRHGFEKQPSQGSGVPEPDYWAGSLVHVRQLNSEAGLRRVLRPLLERARRVVRQMEQRVEQRVEQR